MSSLGEELGRAFRDHEAYSYIAEHYNEMSKKELMRVCLGCIYELTQTQDIMVATDIEDIL